MSVTQFYKNDKSLPLGKNSVIALNRSLLRLQFVDQVKVEQNLDDLKEFAKACHANGAIDITVLISDADLHTFKLDFIKCACLDSKSFEHIGVKVSYLFADDQGRDLCVPHEMLPYFVKYESVAADRQKMVRS